MEVHEGVAEIDTLADADMVAWLGLALADSELDSETLVDVLGDRLADEDLLVLTLALVLADSEVESDTLMDVLSDVLVDDDSLGL